MVASGASEQETVSALARIPPLPMRYRAFISHAQVPSIRVSILNRYELIFSYVDF